MIINGFDRWSHTYDSSALQPAYREAHHAVLTGVRRLVRCPGRILDVGCGTGQLLRLAGTVFPGSRLVGLDASGGMLTVAGHRLPRVQAVAERLPFRDHTFDLVLSTASIHHWSDDHLAMAEVRRVLVPGGLLGLADLAAARRPGPAAVVVRRQPTPACAVALAAAGLHTVSVDVVDGFGPVPAITIVLAQHRPPGRLRRPRALAWG